MKKQVIIWRQGHKVPTRQDSENQKGLEKALTRRLQLTEDMFHLATDQLQAIRSEDWESLKTILGEKDERITDFSETEKHIEKWKPLRDISERTPALKDIISRTKARLVAIQRVEEECRTCLMNRQHRTEKTLHEIRRARQAVQRFRPPRPTSPRFIDLRK